MNKELTAEKLTNSTKIFVGVCNKIVESVNAILLLPPQGEGAKAQVAKEVKELFKQLNEQSKSLEITIISSINTVQR